ncbi:MAG TPA: DUF350 domain-containing protein [Gemmataceae bacterium]|nr:DUF350 domain-containing protein [Gemmataceae bacterium]
MRRILVLVGASGSLLIVLAAAAAAWAQDAGSAAPPVRWHPDSLLMAIVSTVIFGGIGIVLAIIGFEVFDLITPFKLKAEICEKQNVAVAILCSAMILGICIIVAAAVL